MMPFSPYFNYPYYNKRSFNNLYNFNAQKNYKLKKEPPPKDCSNNYTNTIYTNNSNDSSFTTPTINNCNDCKHEYEEYINIFGFKLYFDDLLILALLFFLYKEDIKDEALYIILIMLLFQ